MLIVFGKCALCFADRFERVVASDGDRFVTKTFDTRLQLRTEAETECVIAVIEMWL